MKFLFISFFIFSTQLCANFFVQQFESLKKDVLNSVYTDENSKIQNDRVNEALYHAYFKYDSIKSLDDSLFKRFNSTQGLWVPTNFIKNIGGGLFFLEHYDPYKTPILFVHGAGGNPTEWSSIIHSIDRKKYQVILAYYASGLEISLNARIIKHYMDKLIEKYKIKKLVVMAHSMGGLVSRKLIGDLNYTHQGMVDTFISLATPWNGFEGADNSRDLFFRLPLWKDMASDSKYISDLKSKKYLAGVEHYLFYGDKGKEAFYLEDKNDGVVSLQSQTAQYAQERAKKVQLFHESHVGILHSKDVLKVINTILEGK